jgi:hypothetical protein
MVIGINTSFQYAIQNLKTKTIILNSKLFIYGIAYRIKNQDYIFFFAFLTNTQYYILNTIFYQLKYCSNFAIFISGY